METKGMADVQNIVAWHQERMLFRFSEETLIVRILRIVDQSLSAIVLRDSIFGQWTTGNVILVWK